MGERDFFPNWRNLFLRPRARLSQPEGAQSQVENYEYERPFREFALPQEVQAGLNRFERELLDTYVDLAKAAADLYNVQAGRGMRGNFYERGIPKRQILKEAETNPKILSPTHVVRKNPDATLNAISMHEFYARQIQESNINQNLAFAANLTTRMKDDTTADYLKAKAAAFRTGDDRASQVIWLTRPDEPLIDLVMGFYDTYDDKFLGNKNSMEAWAGVVDKNRTEESQWFANAVLKQMEQETGKNSPPVKMRIDHTRIISGQAHRYSWTGNSLPSDPQLRSELGTKFIIFEPVFEDKFNQRKLPNLKSVIDPNRRVGIPDSLVKTAYLRREIGHETGHAFVPKGIEIRLQKYSQPMKELYCDLLALMAYRRIQGSRDQIHDREREIALAAVLAEGALEHIHFNAQGDRAEYYIASSTMLEFALENQTVQIRNGQLTWNNPNSVYDEYSDNLLPEVKDILEKGNARRAREFFGRHFNPDAYQPLVGRSRMSLPYDIQPQAPRSNGNIDLISLEESNRGLRFI